MAQIYVDASLTSHRRPNIHLRGNKLMRLEDYKNLPETRSEEELYSLFSRIIADFVNEKVDKNDFLNILAELMERQVLTHAILKEPLITELDNFFYKWMRHTFIDEYGIFPQVEDVAYEIVQ